MGSPPLAVPALRALVEAGHELTLVVTQISRPAGRGLRETQPAIALAAESMGLPIDQPPTLRSERARERIQAAQPDAIVVLAYGKLLPPAILAIPPLQCLNVHLSLLPRQRGASPISGAILTGDPLTGVSVMIMEAGLDTGPVLAQIETPINPEDDQADLGARLADLGARLLLTTLAGWEAGRIEPRPQDESMATWTRPTERDDARLDWHQPADHLWRQVRAYAEWPQAFTWWGARRIRILAADYDPLGQTPPGIVRALGPGRRPRAFAVGTGQGELLPRIIGVEGRRAMPVETFLQGHPELIGATLGQQATV